MSLASKVLQGDRLALSRLLTQIENDTPEGRSAYAELFPHTGNAHLIGVTGAPGTGKSSLVNQLARYYRNPADGARHQQRVAVVAVDPTSPFSGGAIMGDRIRMRDLAGDTGVFIRSMASRGALGGLAKTTASVVMAFDAAGYEVVFIETVGAGQVEVDIARLAHTTLVIDAPGLGDDVQAIKAGILEIADVLVVNKADRPGAEQTARALRNMLNLAGPTARPHFYAGGGLFPDATPPGPDRDADGDQREPWSPPVHLTIATKGEGIPELVKIIEEHDHYLQETGELERRERARLRSDLENHLREALVARWRSGVSGEAYMAALDRVMARKISPRQAAAELLNGAALL
jgi:LAO/AO transport system kinase